MKSKIIVLISILFFVFNANAQPPNGYINTEKVEVIKEYEPILANSKKLDTNAKMPKNQSTNKAQSNVVSKPKFITNNFQPPKIKPIAASKQLTTLTNNFWVKAGYGFPKNPYVDANLHSANSKKINAGAQFIYDATNEDAFKSHQILGGNVYAKKIGSNSIAKAKLGFTDYVYNYYGEENSNPLTFGEDTVKQKFNDLQLNGSFSNMYETRSGFNYNANLQANLFNNPTKLTTEIAINDVNLLLDETYIRYALNDNYVGVGANVQFYNFTQQNETLPDSLQSINNLTAFVNPHFYLSNAGLSLGANIGIDDGVAFVFPSIKFNKNINEFLDVFGVWNKQPKQNTYRSLLLQNQFADRNLALQNSNIEERFGGFKYKIKKKGELTIKVGQQIVENMPLWLPNFSSITNNKYNIFYDEKLTTLKVKPQFNIEINKFEIGAFAEFNSYTTITEEEAWHLPNNIFELMLKYKGIENLIASVTMINVGERPTINTLNEIEFLNPYFDLNVDANYKLNQNFSIFLEGQNLLGTQYQKWYLYDNYFTQLRVGLIAKI